jgi:beta-xylosidase
MIPLLAVLALVLDLLPNLTVGWRPAAQAGSPYGSGPSPRQVKSTACDRGRPVRCPATAVLPGGRDATPTHENRLPPATAVAPRAALRLLEQQWVRSAALTSPCQAPIFLPAAATQANTYRNPIFAQDFPDPMVLRLNAHSYYAYATTAVWESPGKYFPILHSSDLVHWRYMGDVFTHAQSWSSGDYWAPDVIVHAGIYYLYYTGLQGSHCVAVATGRTPTGPFTTRDVIGCADATASGYIDPDVFIDSHGHAYLYVSVDNPTHSISVVPLSADLLHAAGPRRVLFGVSQSWERGIFNATVEGPFLIQHDGLYYLFYSGNDWNRAYGMGYATSRSPLGPFTKCACNPILRGAGAILGPGGGSVVLGPDNRDWLVFHAWDYKGLEGYQEGVARALLLEPIRWRGAQVSIPRPTNAPQPMP